MNYKGESNNDANTTENQQQLYSCSICVAGKSFSIHSPNPNIKNEYQNYITNTPHIDYTIELSEDSIAHEAGQLYDYGLPSSNAFGEKVAVMYNYLSLESLVLLHRVSDYLYKFGVLLIHSAAIAVDNRCFLFVAPSGTGKTTHALNWLKMIPSSFIVNGDKPFIDVVNRIVYGSPWSGKEQLNCNTSVPLSAIVLLERGKINTIENVRFQEILPSLFSQVYSPDDPSLLAQVYSLIGLLHPVPCFKLKCTMESESAIVAYNGLMGIRNA